MQKKTQSETSEDVTQRSALLQIAEFDPGSSLFPISGTSTPFVASANIGPDLSGFTLLFEILFAAEVGPGLPIEAGRSSYVFKLVVQQKPGVPLLQTSIPLNLTLRGHVSMASGSEAQLIVLTGSTLHTRKFAGPLDEVYRWDVDYAVPASRFSNFSDRDRIEVVAIVSIQDLSGRSEGIISLDSIDGTIGPLPSEQDREHQSAVLAFELGRRRERLAEWVKESKALGERFPPMPPSGNANENS